MKKIDWFEVSFFEDKENRVNPLLEKKNHNTSKYD